MEKKIKAILAKYMSISNIGFEECFSKEIIDNEEVEMLDIIDYDGIPLFIFYSIWETAQEDILRNIEEFLQKKDASFFCSCYEGDLYDRYKRSVKELIKEIKHKIKNENKND